MSDAHEQIRNLLGCYCDLMDAGNFDGLAALFADGRLSDEHGNVFCTGSEAMAKMWRAQTITYDGSPRTRHVTANPVIAVDEEAGRATVRSSYVVFQGLSDVDGGAIPLQPIVSGRYRDEFTRGADGIWRWAERSYAIDHAGDLTHHLDLNRNV
jgi:3-phenylpropionate/cinnamic acid dioxygenase small subunit